MLTQNDIVNARNTLDMISISDLTVRQEALAILKSATNTAKAIMKRRKALDEQGLQNEPLIVLAGENHTRPTHTLHHMLVLNSLKNIEPRTGFAAENPHNLLQKHFNATRPYYNGPMPEHFNLGNFKDDALYHMAYMTYSYGDAPQSTNLLYHACLQKGITVKFVDAARTKSQYNKDKSVLDTANTSTGESIKACLGPIQTEISLVTPDGIRVRNQHMVTTTKDYAKKTKARIILLQCGATHVSGAKEQKHNFAFKHSLSHMFKIAGSPILAYSLVEKENSEHRYLKNLDPAERHIPDPLPTRTANISATYAENAYANTMMIKLGLKEFTLSEMQMNIQGQKYKEELHNIYKRTPKKTGHNKP